MSRKPDYKLKAINKSNEKKGEIGAAWINENGIISIVLDPFVAIRGQDDLVITLFPQDGMIPADKAEIILPIPRRNSSFINKKYSIVYDSIAHNRIHQALSALLYIARHGHTAEGNEQNYNSEHCGQIAKRLMEVTFSTFTWIRSASELLYNISIGKVLIDTANIRDIANKLQEMITPDEPESENEAKNSVSTR